MWGSGRRKRTKVLYYAARHCSQTFVLRRNAGCGSSTEGYESITDTNTIAFFSSLNFIK